jgi:adenylate cyclase
VGDAPFSSGDIHRVRAVAALEASGVALQDVAEAISAGELSLAYLDYVAQPPPVLERTQADFCAELGFPFDVLERVYLAFGLPPPIADEEVREDDAAIHRGIKLLLDSLEEADVLHSARVFGDGLRRIAEYQIHLFHTRIEEQFRRAGVPEALVLDVALREIGVHTTPLGEQFAAWLYRRHSETFTVEHRVLHGEADLERAGIRPKAAADPAAIAFLDISGYTRLTEELGDEASAAMPMRLAVLVQEAAARHGGRTLKWIGDGVELYFRRPGDAVLCALELCEKIPAIEVPGAHVGINAGPLVYENGDFYGRTVNIAARIAAHATGGQVLVSEAVASRAAGAPVRFTALGPVAFKGVSEDVVVFEAHRS